MSTDVRDRLGEEHAQLQRAVAASRRGFAQSPLSAWVREMTGAMESFRDARAQGVSFDVGCDGLEAVLRSVWSRPTSKFAPECSLCDDLGRRERQCTDEMRCGRKFCLDHPAYEHGYLELCGCVAGDRFRPRGTVPDDEIAAAGRVKKPKPGGWKRL